MFYAIRHGADQCVAVLLEHGANPHTLDRSGDTQLSRAIERRNLACTKLLIEHQADVNQKGFFQWTALHSAAYFCSSDYVQFLIDHRADINARASDGFTPLHTAATSKDYEMMKTLLVNQADPNTLTERNSSPLTTLHGQYSSQLIWLLLDNGATLNPIDKTNMLRDAAYAKNWDVVQTLLALGARVPASIPEENRAHQLAWRTRDLSLCESLIDDGLDKAGFPEEAQEKLEDYHPQPVVFVHIARYHLMKRFAYRLPSIPSIRDLKKIVKKSVTTEGGYWNCSLKLNGTILDERCAIDTVFAYPPLVLDLEENWAPWLHKRYPRTTRRVVHTMVMIHHLEPATPIAKLPPELMYEIFKHLGEPMSRIDVKE